MWVCFVRLVMVGMVVVMMVVMEVWVVMGILMNGDGKAIRKMHSGCGWQSRVIGDSRRDFAHNWE